MDSENGYQRMESNNITKMNKIIDSGAKPWYDVYGGKDEIEVTE